MDYLSLEPDGRGTKNVLVITDHFTKYAVAVPTTDQKEKTVAKALWNNFLVHTMAYQNAYTAIKAAILNLPSSKISLTSWG